MPCGDSRECNVKTEIKIAAADNHDHDSNEETCTPCCSLACCARAVNFQQFNNVKVPALNFQSLKSWYNDDFHSYNLHSIWQPPRVG